MTTQRVNAIAAVLAVLSAVLFAWAAIKEAG